MANERNVARARLRHSSRDAYRSATTPGEIQESGLGSAARGLIKMATRSKYPKFAPKKASLEDKIKYREARAKDLKKIRDKKKAKTEAKKQDRIDTYRAKMAKKREKAARKRNKESGTPTPAAPKWRNFGEEKRMAKAYYDRQRQVPITEAKENAAKRAAASKRPSYAERRAAKYRESADRIERMQAGYKYKGGSGTRGGFRRGY